jgi:NAD-dependent SIR2 family protein deacetylase
MEQHFTHSQGDAFLEQLSAALPALVLTGAGISVGTGIPTYRDEKGTWLRSAPITHQEFVREPRQRQRYWGRSLIGWPGVREARPAAAHRALVQLQASGAVTHIVTQNVDRLHQRAGSDDVTDLHGRLDRVLCLVCGRGECREQLQERLQRLNPDISGQAIAPRPDGDADLPESVVDRVQVADCNSCGGTLMPDVVFFGGSIPGERVLATRAALQRSASLLVIGSSLQVYSGYRFCRWAQASEKPVFILNPGITRADSMACKWAIDADSGLTALLAHLRERDSKPAREAAI